MSFRFFAEAPLYEVQEILGESLLSEVYLAFRQSRGFKIPVVIKLFRQKDGAFLQMESLLRARSGQHLVRVLSFEKFQARPALIMEYVEGVSLKTLMSKREFSQDERACICTQILKGLKELKKVGLSHGDLSLSNILINRKGHLYLTDYGLANYAEEMYGTEPFLAPELIEGQPATFASDLFSLGVLEKIMQGADHTKLKSEHFICEGDVLLDPLAFRRREKPFPFSQKAVLELSERVSEALFMKTCLPPSSSLGDLKVSPSRRVDLNEAKKLVLKVSQFNFKVPFPLSGLKSIIRGGWHNRYKPRFWHLGISLVLLVFFVNPFVSYEEYEPEQKRPATIYIRSQEWLYVQIAGRSGYTPFTVSVREPGLYKLKWKKRKSQGAKYVYLKSGQKTVLKDKDFPE